MIGTAILEVPTRGLPIESIEQIQPEVHELCGGLPAKPERSHVLVTVIKWVDGNVIDTAWKFGG